MVGLFLETGPKLFDPESGSLIDNAHSWHKVANMLYVDNPVGTGFSTVDHASNSPHTAIGAADHLIIALQNLFSEELEQFKDHELWVFGESYGAKYAISLAHLIMIRGNTGINLQGIALGNGWVNPTVQERVYGQLGYGIGIINYQEYVTINNEMLNCQTMVSEGKYREADNDACTPGWTKLLNSGGGFNPYDSRMLGDYSMLSKLADFLNRGETRQRMGTDHFGVEFSICDDDVFDNFLDEFQKSYADLLIGILSSYSVLVFNGQFDLRCSVAGTNEWLRMLDWEGRISFNYLEHNVFYDSNNVTRGIFKSHLNLMHVVLYNAGHLTPYDAPEASLEMVQRFVTRVGMCTPYNVMQDGGCKVSICPNECSNHGSCDVHTGRCVCDDGFSREDCSVHIDDAVIGQTKTNRGTIFGKGLHVYRALVSQLNNQADRYDVKFHLKKRSYSGHIHLFAYVGAEYREPSVENLAHEFPFHNMEDINEKWLNIDGISRKDNSTHVTLVLYNIVDAKSEYEIAIIPEASSVKMEGHVVAGIAITSTLAGVSIALGVTVLVQCICWMSANREK